MTDEPDGAYDWPHAVGAESHAELIGEIGRLRGLLEAANILRAYVDHDEQCSFLLDMGPCNCGLTANLAAYDKLKEE